MPAPAVIPAPIAYTKVAAVKKLVVRHESFGLRSPTALSGAEATKRKIVGGVRYGP